MREILGKAKTIRELLSGTKYSIDYPPDMQARATELVLEQAEVLCKDWSTDSGC